MFKQIEHDVYNYISFVVAFAIAVFTNLNVIYLILSGAVCGLIISLIKQKKSNENLVVAQVEDLSNQDTEEVDK